MLHTLDEVLYIGFHIKVCLKKKGLSNRKIIYVSSRIRTLNLEVLDADTLSTVPMKHYTIEFNT